MAKDSERASLDERPLVPVDSAILGEVRVELCAKLGAVSVTIGELTALKPGSLLKLNAKLNEPVELRLNQTVVARGEIVAVDDSFGVRILEVAKTS
jgi:flagellar motor switch protein FliN